MDKSDIIDSSDLAYFGSSLVAASLPPDWIAWIAENILANAEPKSMLAAMVASGIAEPVARLEILKAAEHPYILAAQKRAGASASTSTAASPRLRKRDWVLACLRHAARQSPATASVPRIHKPSRQDFLDDWYSQNRPVVIEGALNDWPALSLWTSQYLKQKFGGRTVQVQANRNSDADYERNGSKLQRQMNFGEYIDTIEAAGQNNNWYMTANNSGANRDALAELWNDFTQIPEYLRADDPANRGFFWFGPAGTITPLHHDLTNNFMAQVRGRKLIRLVAPYDLPLVYNDRHCFSQIDLDRPDFDRFPLFKEARIIDVTIAPGDLLFLPVGWWHYVRGLDISITMTFTNFIFDNDFYSFYSTFENV